MAAARLQDGGGAEAGERRLEVPHPPVALLPAAGRDRDSDAWLG